MTISWYKTPDACEMPAGTGGTKMKSDVSPKAPSDLQEHIARLTKRGLVTQIDRRIDKDSELHPLARWQFQGGLREEDRRAFLFTNVVGAHGEIYDIPVLVGELGASP